MKTSTQLVDYVKEGLNLGKVYYLWGTYGQTATQALWDKNTKQYPDNGTTYKSYAYPAIAAQGFWCDCYGVVKGFLMGGSWVRGCDPKYQAQYDTTADGAYSKATKKGTISAMPEIPGLVLHMSGHVGIYIGKGEFIECAGNKGLVKGTISNGKVTKGSHFTEWFQDININYSDKPVQPKEESDLKIEARTIQYDNVATAVNIATDNSGNEYVKVDDLGKIGLWYTKDATNKLTKCDDIIEEINTSYKGTNTSVHSKNMYSSNYIKMQDLSHYGLNISYNEATKTPTVN